MSIKKLSLGILLFATLFSTNSYASWKDYREGKKTISYNEILACVPKKENKRRSLCAALVTIAYFKEKGKLSYEKGIYGSAWDMHERLKKNSINLKENLSLDSELEDILLKNTKEGDLIFAKHLKSRYSHNITHVAIYVGEGKIYQQFTNPENNDPPKVEVISIKDFLKIFKFKDVIRPFDSK